MANPGSYAETQNATASVELVLDIADICDKTESFLMYGISHCLRSMDVKVNKGADMINLWTSVVGNEVIDLPEPDFEPGLFVRSLIECAEIFQKHGPRAATIKSLMCTVMEPIKNVAMLNYILIELIQSQSGSAEDLAVQLLDAHKHELTPQAPRDGQDTNSTYMQIGTWKGAANLLHCVTYRSRLEILKKLLDNVQSICEPPKQAERLVRTKDNRGRNLLSIAIEQLDSGCVALLIGRYACLLQDCDANPTKSPPLQLFLYKLNQCEFSEKLQTEGCLSILRNIVGIEPDVALTTSSSIAEPFSYVNMVSCTAYAYACKSWEYYEKLQREPRLSKSRELDAKKFEIFTALVDSLEDLIFRHLVGPNIRAAGYYNNTELILRDYDITDVLSHGLDGLRAFIRDLAPIPNSFEFPGKLSRLVLPDLSRGKAESMTTIYSKLFELLHDPNVFDIKKIYRIVAKDNPDSPVDDATIASWVHRFKVEALDWMKVDSDISHLTDEESEQESDLRLLTLYSSGQEKPIEKWINPTGLPSIKSLESVKIIIDLPHSEDPQIDFNALKERISESLEKNIGDRCIKLDISLKGRIYPGLSANIPRRSLNQQFLHHCEEAVKKFHPHEEQILEKNYIKVAIIDSGVSISNEKVRYNIKSGDSSVMSRDGDTLPWYTYKDPHGAHLAHIICSVNPNCFLYIYRVKDGIRDSISPYAVARGIRWAVEQGVDIINLSLSFDVPHKSIHDAVSEAARGPKPTLVFCAKSDEILSNNVYPADWPDTISVEMVPTIHGHSGVGRLADLVLLGDNFPVDNTTMSGSSASTGIASGLASLLLLLARVRGVNDWTNLKDASRMMSIFRHFKADSSNAKPFVDTKRLFGDLDLLVNLLRVKASTRFDDQ